MTARTCDASVAGASPTLTWKTSTRRDLIEGEGGLGGGIGHEQHGKQRERVAQPAPSSLLDGTPSDRPETSQQA